MPDRTPPSALADRYELVKSADTDISEHLDTLRTYASECEHVTEMGMRAGISTTALLAAQPAVLVTWDLDPRAVLSKNCALLASMAGRTSFQPRVGNTLEVTTEPTDMLFIDTYHTGFQLKAELIRHGFAARKYLAFHDTATFGHVGENGEPPGLRDAIHWFMKKHAFPIWRVVHDVSNNNGLVVLENVYRDSPAEWARVCANLKSPEIPR